MDEPTDDPSAAPPPPGGAGVSGWYPDPWSATRQRYWTGAAWTFTTRHAVAPPTAPPSPTAAVPRPSPPVGPTARRPLIRPRLLVAVALGLLLGLFGVALLNRSSSPSSDPAAPAAPTSVPSSPNASVPTPGGTDPSASALLSLVVKQPDVAGTMAVTVLPGGTGLGRPTLDLCNGTFASESRRTARLQDVVLDGQGQAVLSTEAVLYADSTATTQAFSQLRSVAGACPSTPVPSPVGDPTVMTTINPPPDSSWPQTATVNRLAFDFRTDDRTGEPTHSLAVYLQRGRALLGVYFLQPDAPQAAVAGKTTVAEIVGVFAARLAALPTSVVGS